MIWWIYIIIVYAVAVVLFHVYMRYVSAQRLNYDSKYVQVIIEPWYCPFLGPVLSLLDIEVALKKWRDKYRDSFTVYILGKHLTIITNYIDVKKYYHASDNSLSLSKIGAFIVGSAYPESHYMVDHNTVPYLQRAMAPNNLVLMASNIEAITNDYFNAKNGQFWQENGDEVVVNFFEFVYRLILRTNSVNFISQRVYKNHVEEIIKLYTILDIEKNALNPIINSIKGLLGFRNERDAAWERWITIMTPDIERCKKMIEHGIEPTTLDTIYEAVRFAKQELEKRGQPFSPRLVAFLTFTTFFPAQFTTYVTSSYVLLQWMRHEHDEIGQRIKEEIDCAPPTGELTMEYLNSMQYVEGCIYEAIRLSTDSQLSLRYAEDEFILSDGKRIPRGNIVAIAMTRAEEMYVNPKKFDPERHLPPREENKIDPYKATPFGRGKHPCTGEKYVKMQIKTLLIQLVKMCKMEIMKESMNFEATINKKQLIGLSRPTKPVYVKISKKQ